MSFTRNVGNRSSTYNITDSEATIILAKNDIVNVENGNGIFESTDYNSNAIKIDGEIHITNGSGLRLDGMNNAVTTGFDSIITGNIGIWLNNGSADPGPGGNTILNQGQIFATANGIRNSDVATSIRNFGTLHADHALVGTIYGLTLTNEELAKIDGDSSGIDLSGVTDLTQQSKIVNDGTISGDIAIIGGAEQEKITNHGTITGNVELGDGNDLFDGRGGTVDGLIEGGNGNDTYIIDSADINLHEAAGGGTGDAVEPTFSFRLGANFEDLFLLGSAKNGTGNGEANSIHGNNVDNKLSGGGGADILFGGKGDDVLIGGGGADHFIFQDGFDHDTIKQFKAEDKGHDVIDLSDVSSITSFSDLMKHHVELHHGNLVIDAGHGDTITLEHVSKGDLHAGDFLFAA